MSITNKEDVFLKIFKNSIKIDARTISIRTLLSKRNLNRINYTPYYQRNYVWDNIKQTFFIESVILGTEIPPLILFKSGAKIEVIDGRQRFETLKRFKENDIILSSKGLFALPALKRKSFNTLDAKIQEDFWDSHIRVFEFEVVNEPNLDNDIEDKIKKEIFRRYNTGITPLTTVEVDSAKYDNDPFTTRLKEELTSNEDFQNKVKHCFFCNTIDNGGLIDEMVNYLRRCYTLTHFPISRYATGSERTEILDLLYDFAQQNIEDIDTEIDNFKSKIDIIFSIYEYLAKDERLKNKLIYECLFWGIRILDQENIPINIIEEIDIIKDQYLNYLSVYSEQNSHFYRDIIGRFSNTAELFEKISGFNFDIYIRKNDFGEQLKGLKQNDKEAHDVIKQLNRLRLNKPAPVSKPIDEIQDDVKTDYYLIRPSYQRKEKVSILKASSIIESILLGINLPPIFVYQTDNRIKEVIDGQQRLLSIIGFLGAQYKDENGKLVISKNNNFKLKGLKILSELNGKNYSDLPRESKDKILDFDIDEIIIEKTLNKGFDPTDLFIRLNQKPYPIQQNSFEMWNSTVDKDIVEEIKKVTKKHVDWFYSKENSSNNEERTDRMENEELITILSFISYNNNKYNNYNKILGLFPRQDRITCRLKNKTAITEFLEKLEKDASEKEVFLNYIKKVDTLITQFGLLFEEGTSKESLNNLFNVKEAKIYRRSFQDFYITWLILDKVPIEIMENKNEEIKADISKMLCLLKNVEIKIVDESYLDVFTDTLNKIGNKYIGYISKE